MKRAILIVTACLAVTAWGCGEERVTGITPAGSGVLAEPTEDTGNNLATPVIWSDGVTKSLRGSPLTEVLNGQYMEADGQSWFLQQDPDNSWQAESADWSDAPVAVTWIDWGDNLEAKAWTENSIVRTETVLYQDLVQPMTGYQMRYLFGEGPDEMWGCNGARQAVTEATVYSGCARLTIQKLLGDPNDPDAPLSLTWNADRGQWEGDIAGTYFNSGVWNGVEGPESPSVYSAEINVPGRVIYGYNWNVRRVGGGPGYYRLTFSLDPLSGGDHPDVPLNTFFVDGVTGIRQPAEEAAGVYAATADEGGDTGGGVAVIDFANNLTYIDVSITERVQGGGGHNRPDDGTGGGGGGGPGGGGRR